MPRSRSSSWFGPLAFVSLLVLAASGCSRPATSPVETGALAPSGALPADLDAWFGPDGVVDLRTGRVTEVESRYHIEITNPTQPPVSGVQNFRYTVTGTAERRGVVYTVEQEFLDGSPTFESKFRQDRSGLYLYDEIQFARANQIAATRESGIEAAAQQAILAAAHGDAGRAAAFEAAWAVIRARRAAVATALGAPSAPGELAAPIVRHGRPGGGPGEFEITMLRYPLRPGATWQGRENFNLWTVEGLETVETPAGRIKAARLSIGLPEYYGPNDRYVTWWGAPGELKREFTSTSTATREDGTPIGTFHAVETRTLTTYVPGGAQP